MHKKIYIYIAFRVYSINIFLYLHSQIFLCVCFIQNTYLFIYLFVNAVLQYSSLVYHS